MNSTLLKDSYTIIVMGVLGVIALVTSILVAWPALAHLGAKLSN